MRPHVRRAIAFIAGRLITGKSSTGLFDYSEGRHVSFSGKVTKDIVSIYDYDRGTHVGGSLSNLYFYGDGCGVQISIQGNRFNGFDFCDSGHFSGQVQGNTVWVYDYRSSINHTFLI